MAKRPAQRDQAVSLLPVPEGYARWLDELKSRIHTAQQRAALAVNRELVLLYWQIGRDILQRQAAQGWGSKVIERLAHDLRVAFPGMKGFSRANLMYMRAFAEAWPDAEIVQQAVGQLPWGHNLVLLTKLKAQDMRLTYAQAAIEHGWSRNVLNIHIETRRLERSGQAITNFVDRLPMPGSDLAQQSLKDPYLFDFLDVGNEADEREIESALVRHITQFLLELGAGFAFVGRQVHLEVGGEDFYLDLLFYHVRLRRYVVVELKNREFQAGDAGQMNLYLSAADDLLRHPDDQPAIGLLLCKGRNKLVVEYALRGIAKPIGVAAWKTQLVDSLPPDLQSSLPTVAQIEAELAGKKPAKKSKP